MHISVEPDIGEKIKELLNHTSILAMQIAASKETSLSNLLKSKYIKNEELSVESTLYNLNKKLLFMKHNQPNKSPKFARYAGGTAKPLRVLSAPWLKRYGLQKH